MSALLLLGSMVTHLPGAIGKRGVWELAVMGVSEQFLMSDVCPAVCASAGDAVQ